jgi:hypothetical protein
MRLVVVAVTVSSFVCVGALVRAAERGRTPAPIARPALVQNEALGQEEPKPTAPISAPPLADDDPAEPSATTPAEDREAARKFLELHEIDHAIALAQRAVLADRDDATGWLILGAAQMEGQHLAEATASFRACVKEAKVGPVRECRAFAR